MRSGPICTVNLTADRSVTVTFNRLISIDGMAQGDPTAQCVRSPGIFSLMRYTLVLAVT